MKSITLIPYCPLPVTSGAKSVFMKHINFLVKHGDCRVLSAKNRPVGYGWSEKLENELLEKGAVCSFRSHILPTVPQLYGIAYALLFKSIKREKAFGHSNPYHRYSFPQDWIFEESKKADICEIHYSYWARLKCQCPKVVILHDLWSNIMWEGSGRETVELSEADLVVTVSNDDRNTLHDRGLKNVIWSPPCVNEVFYDDSSQVGIIGSDNSFNREGLFWLASQKQLEFLAFKIMLYGSVSKFASLSLTFVPNGQYDDSFMPYKQCGIIIIPTALGSGLQIKAIEALAAGRAIVARKGAMRGFPVSELGWIEVESPEEMIDQVKQLVNDSKKRRNLMGLARAYYQSYLESKKVLDKLETAYLNLI